MNQHDNKSTRAAKEQTTARLGEITQSPVKTSDRVRVLLNEKLQQSENKRHELDAVIMALGMERDDETKAIDALNKALDALAEEGKPHLELVINGSENE